MLVLNYNYQKDIDNLVTISQLQDSVRLVQEKFTKLQNQTFLTGYLVPESITFCDSTYLLGKSEFGQRVQAGLLSNLQRRGSLITLWQRMGRFFTMIEKELAKQALPSDLKYLVAWESWLDPRVYSAKRAAGLMQLTKESAKDQKLVVNKYIDERLDPIKSVPAGFKHFQQNYLQLGDYLLAVAAYNMGAGALNSRVKSQGIEDYVWLNLYQETERYLPSILALKIIFSDPEKYLPGILAIKQFEPYSELSVKEVRLMQRSTLRKLAEIASLSWLEFYQLNPQFLGRYLLPAGKYQVYYPKEKLVLKTSEY
ncbi:MAG: lytic transglycosylase domain-containing protein [Patescibacteria group bacterium]